MAAMPCARAGLETVLRTALLGKAGAYPMGMGQAYPGPAIQSGLTKGKTMQEKIKYKGFHIWRCPQDTRYWQYTELLPSDNPEKRSPLTGRVYTSLRETKKVIEIALKLRARKEKEAAKQKKGKVSRDR